MPTCRVSNLDGVLGAGRRSSCPEMPNAGGEAAATIDPASQNASLPDLAGVRARVMEDRVQEDRVHVDEIQEAAGEIAETSGAGALPPTALDSTEPPTTELHERAFRVCPEDIMNVNNSCEVCPKLPLSGRILPGRELKGTPARSSSRYTLFSFLGGVAPETAPRS